MRLRQRITNDLELLNNVTYARDSHSMTERAGQWFDKRFQNSGRLR